MEFRRWLIYIFLVFLSYGFDTQNTLIIEEIINLFERPITILDLSYDQQYAKTILESNPKLDCCYVVFRGKQNINVSDKRLVVLNSFLTSNDTRELVTCEDFDVVIVDAKSMQSNDIMSIAMLGLFTLFLNSSIDKALHVQDVLSTRSFVKSLCSDTVTIAQRPCKKLTHGWFFGHPKNYAIINTPKEKFFYNTGSNRIEWQKGINLWTHLVFDGITPDRESIKRQLYKNFNWHHNDYLVWNVIVQGENLRPIDLHYSAEENYQKTHLLYFQKALYYLKYVNSHHRTEQINRTLPIINFSLLPKDDV